MSGVSEPSWPSVTPDEDEAMRRLHFFEKMGAELSPDVKDLKEDIRARDRRDDIRDPSDPLDEEGPSLPQQRDGAEADEPA